MVNFVLLIFFWISHSCYSITLYYKTRYWVIFLQFQTNKLLEIEFQKRYFEVNSSVAGEFPYWILLTNINVIKFYGTIKESIKKRIVAGELLDGTNVLWGFYAEWQNGWRNLIEILRFYVGVKSYFAGNSEFYVPFIGISNCS